MNSNTNCFSNNIQLYVTIKDIDIIGILNNAVNSIFENKFIGVLLRDRSHGVFKQNIIKNNLSQIYFSYNCKQYMDEIIKGNFVEGRHDYEYSCNIF